MIPVNTLPLAYTMLGSVRQWNALTCGGVLTGKTYHLQEEVGRGIRKLNSLARR